MTELITNAATKRHLELLHSLWKKADEISVAVAYLKSTGLHHFRDIIQSNARKGVSQKIVCSLDFGLSEPVALSELRKMFDGITQSGLYLANEKLTFHPKIYCFRVAGEYHIITGSANFTNGGLGENVETSLYVVVPENDKLATQTSAWFKKLFSAEYSEPATELKISQYTAFHLDQEKNRKKYQRQRPLAPKKTYPIDYPTLAKFYREYQSEADVKRYNQEREKSYADAREVLEYLVTENISDAEFKTQYEDLVGAKNTERLWYSGSLFRQKAKVFKHKQAFLRLVRYVMDHQDKSPLVVFDKGKELIEAVPGAGVNILTEIMMTFQPEKFANLNNNPLTVLLKVGCTLKKTPANYSGKDYQAYCDLITEIKKELKLKNNLEVDSFFNHNYWKLKSYK